MFEKKILDEIFENKEEYIEFLRDILKINSYNPPGNEKNVALKIKQYLEDINIKCEIFPFGENRANLIAYLNNNFSGKNLLFNGHMDVVPPGIEEVWSKPPLEAFRKRDKLIIGRGAADMKGGLVAMVIALKILKKLEPELAGNLILNAVSDEETGGTLGTKWCVDNKLDSIKCDFAVIGEPTGLDPLSKAIIIGEKGILQMKVQTKGKPAHSSMAFIGINAISMMCEIMRNLPRINDLLPKTDPPLSFEEIKELMCSAFQNKKVFERILDEQPILKNLILALTKSTCSLNLIKGGEKENIVPEICEALIDFRLLNGQNTEDVIAALKKIITDLGFEIRDEPVGNPEDTFVYLEKEFSGDPSYWENWKESHQLKEFFNIVEKTYGRKPFYFIYPACSDGYFIRNSDYCKQTILFGPGSAGTAHATNEYIEIKDFLNAIKVYTLFASSFLRKED